MFVKALERVSNRYLRLRDTGRHKNMWPLKLAEDSTTISTYDSSKRYLWMLLALVW